MEDVETLELKINKCIQDQWFQKQAIVAPLTKRSSLNGFQSIVSHLQKGLVWQLSHFHEKNKDYDLH